MTVAILAVAIGAYLVRPLAIPALPQDARALEFVDRNGLPLGTILGRGERRTLPVALDRVSPWFVAAVLAAEDSRFFVHGAVDVPAASRAIARAAFQRSMPGGASTLSMQVARMIEPVPSSFAGKVRETMLAVRLEAWHGKRDILSAYCNLAPMGSNVYGVEAAARTYFGIDAAHIDLAQAALLAALPNDPVGLDPYRRRAALERRRQYVLARMAAAGFATPSDVARASAETVAIRVRAEGIAAAPHFLFHLAPRVPDGVARVRTTIDRPLQTFVAAQVRDVVAGLGRFGMHHAAAIVIANATGEVLAYAGSPDYFADDDLGRNDGVQALRQPGSALKPFLYELALERRVVRPDTILADVPTAYALPDARVYAPLDYSTRFLGPVRVRAALANSLNVPAVRVLSQVGVEPFRRRLEDLGFAHLTRAADYYGLGLTLGAGEVTLAELARAYATAARGGVPLQLVETLDAVPPALAPDAPPVDPAWPLVTDMLADRHARAAAFGVDSILALPFPAAVKTGTSSGYRDVWTAGYTRDYTVAVWAGNFDGAPMHGISGVTGAAPLWARIMLHLHETRDPAPFATPPGYVRRTMCAEGNAPGASRCTPVREWLDAQDEVRLAAERRHPQPSNGAAYDEWLIAQPQRAHVPTRILFPHEGDVFVYDPRGGDAQRIAVEIAGPRDASLHVTLDGRSLRAEDGAYVWRIRPGAHVIEARSSRGGARVGFAVATHGPRAHLGFTVAR